MKTNLVVHYIDMLGTNENLVASYTDLLGSNAAIGFHCINVISTNNIQGVSRL